MGLDADAISDHISRWKADLSRPERWAYRAKWPSFLYRHERVENAAKILASQTLLSRHQAQHFQHIDIAAPEVINNNNAAHQFARLYFRPKNPTQYLVEGVRKNHELYQGVHAPVLVMFLFKTANVLAIPNVMFSNGNMQSHQTEARGTEHFFRSIPFDKVFHEGKFDPNSDEGRQILRARCAEVLVPSHIRFDQGFAGVCCRSNAERQTLLHLAPGLSDDIRRKIIVYREVGLFESRYAYVDSIDLSAAGLRFNLHPRSDSQAVTTRVAVLDRHDDTVLSVREQPLDPAKRWLVRKQFDAGRYLVRVWLEGELAHESLAVVDELPF